jgi:hypothetical protein
MTSSLHRITSILLLCLPLVSWSAELKGRVVVVVDGDTLVVLDSSNTQHKIRLAGIDCPERKQPWGQRAKQALSDHVFDNQVTVEWDKVDRYGRTVGKILTDDRDVNLAWSGTGCVGGTASTRASKVPWTGDSTRPRRTRPAINAEGSGRTRTRCLRGSGAGTKHGAGYAPVGPMGAAGR